MIKNSIIGILLGILYFIWIDEFDLLAFVCLTTIIIFCVWAVEETINDFKRKLVFKRRVNKQIDNIKITPNKPTKAS